MSSGESSYRSSPGPGWALAAVGLVGAAVTAALGTYAGLHTPSRRPIFTLGFSSGLTMKAWLTTVVLGFAVVQLLTALWMWGRLPGAGDAKAWVSPVHRWSGTVAFLVSLPVAFHCIWVLGFQGSTPRGVVHGAAGCLLYGAFGAKMLALRLRGLPAWLLPVLGGTVFSLIVLLWTTASLWYFTQPGAPLF